MVSSEPSRAPFERAMYIQGGAAYPKQSIRRLGREVRASIMSEQASGPRLLPLQQKRVQEVKGARWGF